MEILYEGKGYCVIYNLNLEYFYFEEWDSENHSSFFLLKNKKISTKGLTVLKT